MQRERVTAEAEAQLRLLTTHVCRYLPVILSLA